MADQSNKPNGLPSNVVPLGSHLCVSEACKKKASRAGFCDEHFAWFKEGLLTREGKRPTDFDKKYQAFIRRQAA